MESTIFNFLINFLTLLLCLLLISVEWAPESMDIVSHSAVYHSIP